jgi:hypothetical protein
MTNDNRFFELKIKDIENIENLKKLLTIDNPKVAYLIKTVGIPLRRIAEPLKIKLYTCTEKTITIPRAAMDDPEIQACIIGHEWGLNFEDSRINSKISKHPSWNHSKKLRPYQEEPVQEILKNKADIMVLPCGAGKTVCGVNVIGNSELPSIIVIQSDFLSQQWLGEINNFLNVRSLKVVQHKNNKIKDSLEADIVIASVQSLINLSYDDNKEFYNKFKLAIFDEVHSMGSTEFVTTISNFPCRRIGLTATPDRTDGFKTFKWAIGGRIVLGKNPNEIKPLIIRYNTNQGHNLDPINYSRVYRGQHTPNMPQLINCLVEIEARNNLARDMANTAVKHGRHVLLLVHRRATAEALYESISTNSKALRLGGSSNETHTEHYKVIVATFQYAKQAFNAPWLDTLILMTPFGAENDAKQATGRILRVVDGKKPPIVIDFLDVDPSLNGDPDRKGICTALFNKRMKHYKRFGYIIHAEILDSLDQLERLL